MYEMWMSLFEVWLVSFGRVGYKERFGFIRTYIYIHIHVYTYTFWTTGAENKASKNNKTTTIDLISLDLLDHVVTLTSRPIPTTRRAIIHLHFLLPAAWVLTVLNLSVNLWYVTLSNDKKITMQWSHEDYHDITFISGEKIVIDDTINHAWNHITSAKCKKRRKQEKLSSSSTSPMRHMSNCRASSSSSSGPISIFYLQIATSLRKMNDYQYSAFLGSMDRRLKRESYEWIRKLLEKGKDWWKRLSWRGLYLSTYCNWKAHSKVSFKHYSIQNN